MKKNSEMNGQRVANFFLGKAVIFDSLSSSFTVNEQNFYFFVSRECSCACGITDKLENSNKGTN